MWAERWREGKLIAEELYTLKDTIYFKNELVTMLEQAGYDQVMVHGDFTEAEATADHNIWVFIARKGS